MSDLVSFVSIPKLSCEPVYSIARLPKFSEQALEASELVERYGFNSDDLETNWQELYEVYTASDDTSEVAPADSDPCADLPSNLIAYQKDVKYISWLKAVTDLQADRNWIVSANFPCYVPGEDGGEDIGNILDNAYIKVAAVTTKITPSFLSAPTVSPSWGPGGLGSGECVGHCGCSVGKVVGIDIETGKATIALFRVDEQGNIYLSDEEITAFVL